MSPLTFSFSLLKVEKLAVRGSARSLWMYSKRVPSSLTWLATLMRSDTEDVADFLHGPGSRFALAGMTAD